MTKRKGVVLAFVVPTILALLGLGFAAMSINPPWAVPSWTPIVFFILAGLVFLATIAYLMWDILVNLRIQSPVFIINQRGRTNIVGAIKVNQFVPKRLEHNGVFWEERRGATNNLYAYGPLCPKDFTLLIVYNHGRLDTKPDGQTLISENQSQLYCLECKRKYTLGKEGKRIRESQDEAGIRIEGIIRRETKN